MPLRDGLPDVAQLSERGQLLADMCVTESQLAQLKRVGHEEATWRNDHELQMHMKWAQARHDFIQDELDEMLPPRERPKRPIDTPAIQSHRNGPGRTGATLSSVYGERYG